MVVVVAAVAGTFALALGAVVGAVALAGRRTGVGRVLRPIALVAAPVAIAAVGVVSAVELVGEASRLL